MLKVLLQVLSEVLKVCTQALDCCSGGDLTARHGLSSMSEFYIPCDSHYGTNYHPCMSEGKNTTPKLKTGTFTISHCCSTIELS